MAKKRKETEDPKEKANRELISKILDRWQRGSGANELNRRNHTADLMFIWGADQQMQWDPAVLQLRAGRPSYTFNLCLQPVNNLLGDQRQTRPSIKVRPASENATPEKAEILGGLWRSIFEESRGDAILDEQYKQCVGGGFGEVAILPKYENNESFHQVLRLINIPNPEAVVRDPESTDPCGADAEWGMIGSRISHETYKEMFPGFDPASFPMSRDSLGWRTDGMVRIVDYFEKTYAEKEIAELNDGRVIDWDDEAKKVDKHLESQGFNDDHDGRMKRTRKVKYSRVRWVKCDGAHILSEPVEYKWNRIPIARMPGRYINIEGRQILQSLIRHAWDPQRAFNFQQSDAIERSALVPKARYLVTAKMINGYDNVWNQAHITPRTYLPYNVDPDAAATGGKPEREQPIDLPAGSIQLAQEAAANVQKTIGIYDPSLGNADDMNRVSGKALVTHTRRSDLGTHEFIDNYGKCVQLLCEMALDMAPTVYDSERVVRIINGDGQEKNVAINKVEADGILNDLSKGQYDCTVTLGPSYQTARQETLQTLIDAAQTVPAIAQVTPDLIAKFIDSPESEEMSKRLRGVLIKQGIVQPTPQDQKNMPPPQPNPMQQAQLQEAVAKAKKAAADAQIAGSKASAGDLEIHRVIVEAANKHLENLKLAQEIGQPNQAAVSEAQAAAPLRQNTPAAPGAPPIPGQ